MDLFKINRLPEISIRILLVLFFINSILSCKNKVKISKKSVKLDIEVNLIKNSNFSNWDEFWKPKDWGVLNKDEKSRYVRPVGDSLISNIVSINKGIEAERYIYQTVKVKKNTYYFLSSKMDVNLNSVQGGIYVVDNVSGKVIMKNCGVYVNGIRNVEMFFNSKESNTVMIKIGFLDQGIGGVVNVDNVKLIEESPKENLFERDGANKLNKVLKLYFSNKENFNNSIERLVKFVNSALLSERRNDSIGRINFNTLKNVFESNKLKGLNILNESSNTIMIAYDQKASFISSQLLELFHIDSHVVNFELNGKRRHTLLEYFNPFEVDNKINMIDPFFNISLVLEKRNLEEVLKRPKLSNIGGVYKSIKLFSKRLTGSQIKNTKTDVKLTYPF